MRYKIRNNVVILKNIRTNNHKVIALNVKNSRFFNINNLALKIIKYIDGQKTVDEIVEIATKKLNIAAKEIRYFLKKLIKLQILEPSNAYSPPPITNILSVEWVVNSICNLDCKHCYLKNVRGWESLDYNQILSIINDLKNNGVKILNFIGMEPLLRDDFFDIINYSVHHDFFISIDTNGTFIDKFLENLSRSSDVKPYLSRIAFQLSLDGYDSQTHGFIRNNYNHFEIVLSSIQKLKSVGFTVVVETVLHDAILDFDSLYKIFKILSSLKVDKWNVMDIHPILNTKYLKYFIPSPYKIFTAFKALGQISKVSSFPINFPFKGVLGNGKLKGGLMYVCEHDDLGENFAILPDGNVTWCSRLFTSEFLSGNIYVEGFKTVYSKLKKHQIFKMKVSDTLCNKCPYAKYCGAGCRANAYWLEQDIKAKDNIACNYWKVWERLKKEILLNEKI